MSKEQLNNGRSFDDVGITDSIMFSTVFQENSELCRKLLESILGFEIEKLTYLEREKAVNTTTDNRGVRLDILARGTGKLYNVEMQNRRVDDIPRRSRFYQAELDTMLLGRGEHYSEIPDSFEIFICRFDLFGEGQYVYRFKMLDLRNHKELGDGTERIFVNTAGTEGNITPELREFIDYINDPKVVIRLDNSNWIKQVDDKVRLKRSNGEWRHDYMMFESMMQDKYREGLKEGKAEGEVVGIAKGEASGEKRGILKGKAEERTLLCRIFKLSRDGLSYADIAKEVDMPENEIRSILG